MKSLPPIAMKNLPPIDARSYKPLREQVYELLREAIITGRLQPGEALSEIQLACQLNVSRTPVREAMRLLQLENLIVMHPRRGAFVAGITSKKEIDDLFKIRVTLESLAVELALENMKPSRLKDLLSCCEQFETCVQENDVSRYLALDSRFHHLIYESTENVPLERILFNLYEQTTRFRRASLARLGRMRAALEEHRQLVVAIGDRNVELAAEIGVRHIRNAWLSIIELLTDESMGVAT